MSKSFLHTVLSLLLAANYFAFQVEVFETEYEANHPKPASSTSFSSPTLTWESFDKTNATKAFVCDAGIRIECLLTLAIPILTESVTEEPYQPIRDKSPPKTSTHLAVPLFS